MEQGSLLLNLSDILPSLTQGGLSEKELETFFQLCKDENNLEISTKVAEYKIDNFFHEYSDEFNDFHLAAQNGDLFLLQSYVLAGINVNLIFEYEDDDSFTITGTALTLALVNNNKKSIKFLLEQPDIKIDIIGVTSIDHSHLLSSLVDDKFVVPFLEMRNSEYESLLDIIKFNVDVRWGNRNEHSCFIHACERGDLDLLRFALEHGADPNQVDDYDYPCEMVWSNLVYKYLNDKRDKTLKLIELVVEFGASINSKTYDSSVLDYVWQSRDEALIQCLGLGYIADELKEISIKLTELATQKEQFERLGNQYIDCFPISSDILSDLQSTKMIPITSRIKRLVFNQISEFNFSIYIEINAHVSSIELHVPDYLATDFPSKSAIKLALHLINLPLEWWNQLEDELFRPLDLQILEY